jgi:hypothetical protein
MRRAERVCCRSRCAAEAHARARARARSAARSSRTARVALGTACTNISGPGVACAEH